MTDTKIGSEYSRKRGTGPLRIRIVGTKDGEWVAQDVDHAPPFSISANRLRIEYGANGEAVPEVDEPDSWHKLGRNWLDRAVNEARRREREQQAAALPPEEKLAAEAAAAEQAE